METPTGPVAGGAVGTIEFNLAEAASAAHVSGRWDGHKIDGRSTAEEEEHRAVNAKGFSERIHCFYVDTYGPLPRVQDRGLSQRADLLLDEPIIGV